MFSLSLWKFFLMLLKDLGIILPIKSERIRRVNEDKAFSHAEAREAFGYAPIIFKEGIHK